MLRYKEIKLAIRELISEMSNGEKLPSRTVLSRRLDSSRATIDKAVRELEKEGILESRFGSGTYVARRLDGVVTNARNCCLILPNITESIYGKLARSVEDAARKLNINIILCNSENNAEKQSEYIKRLIMAGIDGFIIVPVVTKSVIENVGLYQNLQQSKIPFVFCNREVEGVSAPVIKSNDFYGGYLATQHLLNRGYKNISYLANQRYRTSVERCQGYISALQQSGVEIVRRRILMSNDMQLDDCYKKLRHLLASDTPVDAVFCFNDVVAMEAVRAVEAAGLRVSDNVGIIGYDNSDIASNMDYPLTSMAYKTEDVGSLAVRILMKMMENKERDDFDYYLIEPGIVVRESCLGKTRR